MNAYESYKQEQTQAQENSVEYYKRKLDEANEKCLELEDKYQTAIKTLRCLEIQDNEKMRKASKFSIRYCHTPFYWLMFNARCAEIGDKVKRDMENTKIGLEKSCKKSCSKNIDYRMKCNIFYNTLLYGELEEDEFKNILEYAKYISPEDLNKIHDEEGEPMLFFIIRDKDPDIIRQFLNYGVDITVKTSRNEDVIDTVIERYTLYEEPEETLEILKMLYEEFGAAKIKSFNTEEGKKIIDNLIKISQEKELEGYEEIVKYLQQH